MKEAGITMAALLLLAATSARSEPRQEFVAACKAEIAELCPGVEPGEGRIAQCLADKQQKLTKGCHAALRRAKRLSTKAQKANGTPAAGQAAPGDLAAAVNLAASLVDAATEPRQKTEDAPIPEPVPEKTPAAEAQPASTTP